MAQRGFSLERKRSKARLRGSGEKQRIVAEPAAAAPMLEDQAFACALERLHNRALARQGQHAAVTGAAAFPRNAVQALQQQTVVSFVVAVPAREARGVHAGRAAERV